MGASGTTTIDFGAFPGKSDASVAVTGQTSILSGSLVEAWLYPLATADHTAEEHMLETLRVFADASTIVAGVGFTIRAVNADKNIGGDPGAFDTRVKGYGGGDTIIYGLWTVAWVWT